MSEFTEFSESEKRFHRLEDEMNKKLAVRGSGYILVKTRIEMVEIDRLIARLIELKGESCIQCRGYQRLYCAHPKEAGANFVCSDYYTRSDIVSKDLVKCVECGKEIDLKKWKLRSIFASFTIKCPHCQKDIRIVKEGD